MRSPAFLLAALAAGFVAPASAIVLNEREFTTRGGALTNIDGTIAHAYSSHHAASRAAPFFAVGQLGNCVATWLGDIDGQSWFLTGAQCLPGGGASQNVSLKFTDWNGRVTAEGNGVRHLPPSRVAGTGLPSTNDIALVQLPRKQALLDNAGNAVVAPQLYVGAAEVNKAVQFVGYGTWGVGTRENTAWNTSGSRRLRGQSMVAAVRDGGGALAATYVATGATSRIARTSAGDGGAAWWQLIDGHMQIVGIAHGNTNTQSIATRVSPHVEWIRSVVPTVRVPSTPVAMTGLAPYVSTNNAQLAWFVTAGQAGVTAPAGEIRTAADTFAEIVVNAKDQVTGATHAVRLRATRPTGGPLEVRFDPADNAALPSGDYRATFSVEALRSGALHERVHIATEIVHGVRVLVTQSQGYESPNLWPVAHGSLYFLVPATQSGATGPTAKYWKNDDRAFSKVIVQATRASDGQKVDLALRADKSHACFRVPMNNGVSCYYAYGSLGVRYVAADNPHLQAGRYRGTAYIEARSWHNNGYRDIFAVDVDVETP